MTVTGRDQSPPLRNLFREKGGCVREEKISPQSASQETYTGQSHGSGRHLREQTMGISFLIFSAQKIGLFVLDTEQPSLPKSIGRDGIFVMPSFYPLGIHLASPVVDFKKKKEEQPMTKRIGSLLLALIMTISLAVPAMAVNETEQTEEPTASTVEPSAPTDADTSAPTPEETPDTSDAKDEQPEAKKAPAKAAVSVQSVQSDLDAYFADLPLTAEAQNGVSNLQWSVKNGILTSPKGFMQSTRSLILTANADTHLTFEYKVSTEAKYDTFTFTHNTTIVVNGVSGIVDWTLVELDVKAGDTLTFSYTKDSSGNKNDDCIYLRNFTAGEGIPITFHANGGTGEDYTQNIYGGKGTLKANTFTCDGKVFAGWATSADGAAVYTDQASVTVTEALDLYACWADASTVTFDNDGKTSTVQAPTGAPIGSTLIPSEGAKKGYQFDGWFHDDTKLTAETVITEDITFTAKWTPITYTIAFNADGDEGTMDSITATYDQEVTLPACTFTRAGYDFGGWSEYKGSSSGSMTAKNLASKQGASVTLYAAWKGQAVPVTIDYNYEGSTPIQRTCVVGQNYNYLRLEDGSSKFSAIEDPTRIGWIFDGWYDAAQDGNEITNQYKFTDTTPMTLYAHWVKGITVHFDGNGYKGTIKDKTVLVDKVFSSLPYLTKSSYPDNKALEGWYTAKEGGEQVTADTKFTGDEVTLYAHWRDYQYVVKFNIKYSDKATVTGTMADFPAPFGKDVTLPKCTFTREGYRFAGWATSSYGSTVTYTDGATLNRAFEEDDWGDGSEDGEIFNLYAVWTETVFGQAYKDIAAKLPTDNGIRDTTALELPTSGEGYTVNWSSSNTDYLTDAGAVTLPETGSVTVTLTATVTDTETNETETKDYTLTLYSLRQTETENALNAAAKAMTGNLNPVYGTDTNLIDFASKKLGDKLNGITLTIKEDATGNGGAAVSKDGTITYYFPQDTLSGSGTYFYVPFVLEKDGITVEKKWYTNISWDKCKLRTYLEQEIAALTIPTEDVSELSLPQVLKKDGNALGWSNLTWTSSNEKVVKVGSASSYNGDYKVTIYQTAVPTPVTLTATLKCNSVNGVSVTKSFDIVVAAGQGSDTVEETLKQRMDAGFAKVGLRNWVTGEQMTPDADGVYTATEDILIPRTRDFGIDGKYCPVSVTTSDNDVLEEPDVNNAARIWVYRDVPGGETKLVTMTVTMTDKASGVSVSRDFKIKVPALTQEEVDKEIALMEQVKAHYFDGIKANNPDKDHVTTNLHAFREAYLNEQNELTWVYHVDNMVNHGIVPVDMDGWYESEQWRTFRSSNPAIITHENLLVTQPTSAKTVTITSWLSSETLGRYAEKHPDNAQLQKLHNQVVTVSVIVPGTDGSETPTDERQTYSFTLYAPDGTQLIDCLLKDQLEGLTAVEVARTVLENNGYQVIGGNYITAIVSPDGTKWSAGDDGDHSGWSYRINGKVTNSANLSNGDTIELFYTKDNTKETDHTNTPAAVARAIDAIGTVTKDSGDAIQAARAAYDQLTDAQKSLIDQATVDKLTAAEKTWADLNKPDEPKPPVEPTKPVANVITAKSATKVTSGKAQSFQLSVKAKGGAKLTYQSDNKSVKVSKSGKVTIAKNFVGKATITITAGATEAYTKTVKRVTVTVNPTGTTFRSVYNAKGKKLKAYWKKNSSISGYQLQYGTSKQFTNCKTVTLKSAKYTGAVRTKLSKGKTYYVRIRTYKKVGGKTYYSAWSKTRQVNIVR